MSSIELKKTSINLPGLFWGLLLICGGGLALAQSLGYLTDLQSFLWIGIFAFVSLSSLIFYFWSGVQNWGILIPAGVFGALAFIITMATYQITSPAIAAPLFIGIGLPFVVAYLLNRSDNWWALIPAGVMTFLTFVLLAANTLIGEFIGAGLFFILAATFGFVYASHRAFWAGLVSYVMIVLGIVVLTSMSLRPELTGSIMLFAISLPFFLLYFRSPGDRWWALIPAGILGTTGLMVAVLLIPGLSNSAYSDRAAQAFSYFGVAATFSVIWLRHRQRWASIVAFLALMIASIVGFGSDFQQFWPLLVILIGIYMLYSAFRSQKA
jgi:hypothetical protein